jgi:chorismatase
MTRPRNVLGTIRYTAQSGDPRTVAGGLLVEVHTARPGEPDCADVWTTDRPVQVVHGERVHYAHDGEIALFAARIPASARYAALVHRLYAELFALTRSSGYRQIFRVWQHIENLNGENADGLEVYRDFCIGRAAAFEQHDGTRAMPAATAVGVRGGGITLHLLAGREPVVPVENPAQVPAYRYPGQYGPKPPSFARATWRAGELYVSGTSSIVGHRTVHQGDIVAQCRAALSNIERVVGRENLVRHGLDAGFALDDLHGVTVYVRHAQDVPAVREVCQAAFAPHAEVRYVVADLCRSDLLVEIEAVAGPPTAARPQLDIPVLAGTARFREVRVEELHTDPVPSSGGSAGGDARWELWRQDDNGNRFLVAAHAVRADAEAQLAELESGVAHKQFYWITADRASASQQQQQSDTVRPAAG